MSQVQHPILHNIVQPITFLTIGFLAGRKIEYFPGASQGGLMLISGLGTIATLVSQASAPYIESEWEGYIRVASNLALGAAIATLASKALNGRVELNFFAASNLFIVEAMAAGGITLVSHFLKPSLQAQNGHYSQNPSLLIDPSTVEVRDYESAVDERYEFVKACFDADLPPITLFHIDPKIRSILYKNTEFDSMTNNQLLWCAEVARIETAGSEQHENEKIADLFKVLFKKNLPMKGGATISFAVANSTSTSNDVKKAYFSCNPLGYFINSAMLEGVFTDEEKPDPAEYDLNEIRMLQVPELEVYGSSFLRNNFILHSNYHQSLPPEIRVVLLGTLRKHEINYDDDLGVFHYQMTQKIVDILKEDDDALEWFHDRYSRYSAIFRRCVDTVFKDQLNEHFQRKGKTPIN